MANFDAAKAMFTQIDANRDGSIDQNEFQNWFANNGGAGGLTSSSYESSSGGFDGCSSGGFDGSSSGGVGGYESNAQSSFESIGGMANASYAVGGGASSSSNELISGGAFQQTSDYSIQSASNLYKDPNPHVVRRPAATGPITYQQRILVRFLQPPPIPPPGPLIIKEVRPAQPPPPPPLVVRQRAPPLPQLPPLILRERPPIPPAPIASQTVIRRLAAIPIPPRAVIIERLPPLPPKPRDIIIERWIPYGQQAKRRTIVQRALPPVPYPKPRNIIVVYDTVQARVIRQFQRFGVTQENPQAYLSRYGPVLLDAGTLLQQARAAGVVEDISPPAAISSSAQFSSSSSFIGDIGGGGGATAGYNLSNLSASQGFSSSGATGFEGGQVIGSADTGNASYSSSTNFVGDSAFAGSVGLSNTGFDAVSASFAAADINQDGRLDQAEFQRFVQGGFN